MGRFYGVNNFSEIPGIYSYDPRTGQRAARNFRGPPTPVNALAIELANSRIPFDRHFDVDGGYSTIAARYGAAENQDPTAPLADLFDLLGNDLEKSLWICPTVKAEIDKLAATEETDVGIGDIATLRSHVEALARGDTVMISDPSNPDDPKTLLTISRFMQAIDTINADFGLTGSAALSKDVFRKLLYWFSIGETSFVTSQWVLRRRVVVAQNFAPAANYAAVIYDNVNRVYPSTDAMVAWEGIPTNNWSPTLALPNGQWLKKSPTRDQIAADKWQFDIQWWHADLWSDLAYQAAAS